MRDYFNSLNEREQWMVIIAALAVIIYFYYLVLYSPLSNRVTQTSAQLIEKTETLAWMQKIRHQKHALKSKENIDNSQLLTIIADQLKENLSEHFPYQLQQTGTGDIQLTFDEVPFNSFMDWLAKTNNEYTLTIKQLNAERTETPGLTKLMIVLSGGA